MPLTLLSIAFELIEVVANSHRSCLGETLPQLPALPAEAGETHCVSTMYGTSSFQPLPDLRPPTQTVEVAHSSAVPTGRPNELSLASPNGFASWIILIRSSDLDSSSKSALVSGYGPSNT